MKPVSQNDHRTLITSRYTYCCSHSFKICLSWLRMLYHCLNRKY